MKLAKFLCYFSFPKLIFPSVLPSGGEEGRKPTRSYCFSFSILRFRSACCVFLKSNFELWRVADWRKTTKGGSIIQRKRKGKGNKGKGVWEVKSRKAKVEPAAAVNFHFFGFLFGIFVEQTLTGKWSRLWNSAGNLTQQQHSAVDFKRTYQFNYTRRKQVRKKQIFSFLFIIIFCFEIGDF